MDKATIDIPIFVTRFQHYFFENITEERRKNFTVEYNEAIPVDADLSLVLPEFLLWLVKGTGFTDVEEVLESWIKTGEVSRDTAKVAAALWASTSVEETSTAKFIVGAVLAEGASSEALSEALEVSARIDKATSKNQLELLWVEEGAFAARSVSARSFAAARAEQAALSAEVATDIQLDKFLELLRSKG